MKYLILSACLLSLSSCYKAWDCACRITKETPGHPVPEVEYEYHTFAGFKGKVTKTCKAFDDQYTIGSSRYTKVCDLTE